VGFLRPAVFIYEQRKERRNERGDLPALSDEYGVPEARGWTTRPQLLHATLSGASGPEEQKERRTAIFGISSRSSRAYLLVYELHMDKHTQRLWQSWEDYMRELAPAGGFRDASLNCCKAKTRNSPVHREAGAGRRHIRITA